MFLKMQGDFLDVGERLGDVGREIFFCKGNVKHEKTDFYNLHAF